MRSPLVLDVRELLDGVCARRRVALEVPAPAIEAGLARAVGFVRLALVVEGVEGGVLVRGEVRGSYAGSCRRCLAEVGGAIDAEAQEVYRPVGGAWEEDYVIREASIDLEPLVRDALGLALPQNPLCSPDCRGLCPRCGADRNEGPCGCAEPLDPRWSALGELRQGPSG